MHDRRTFGDSDDPVSARAAHVSSELTTDEKIRLLHQHQPAIDRLGLPAFNTGQEAAHGVAWSGIATVFPQPIGLAASWNPRLLEEIGAAVGLQTRQFHHGNRPQVGLNVWAPVVDLLRDPRAGRNEEAYSEDPCLTGALSDSYCRGLTGYDQRRWRTAPTLKHFLAYNNENQRVTTSANVRPRLLHEYYLRAFTPAIRSGAAKAVMLSYNLVNGRPVHVSAELIDCLRSVNPDLVVVSDAYAPSNLAGEQHYFPDHVTAHAAALRAGLDSFTDRGPDAQFTVDTLRAALTQGMVSQRDIDRAAFRLLRMRKSLGEAEPLDDDVSAAGSEAEQWSGQLARRAVRESVVLLRNDGILPLDTHGPNGISSIAVIGPLGDQVLEDWYSGTPPYKSTPTDAISERVPTTRHTAGHDRIRLDISGEHAHQGEYQLQDWGDGLVAFRASDGFFLTRKQDGALVADQQQPHGWDVHETFRLLPHEHDTRNQHKPTTLEHVATGERYPIEQFRVLTDGVAEATAVAAECDAAVLVVGNHPLVGARETTDRNHLDLPETQRRLIHAVSAANARTVLVVESGYPYALAEFEVNVPTILWLAHGGQETGHGLADVLFGDVSPSGRLPQSWYGSSENLDAIGTIDEYDIIASKRTYQYQSRPPLYPFGHGLSYVDVEYSGLRVERDRDDTDHVAVDVTNLGNRASDEVIQFYARRTSPSRVDHPSRRLIGFRREELPAGSTRTVKVELDPIDAFAIWDVRSGSFLIEQGQYVIEVGASSTDIRDLVTVDPGGTPLPARRIDSVRAADFDRCRDVRLQPDRPLRGEVVAVAQPYETGCIDFHDMDFRALAGSSVVFTTRASGPGRLRVHIGSARDPLLVVELDDTSERITRVRCTPPSAIADLCIVLQDSARLAEFWFERSRES